MVEKEVIVKENASHVGRIHFVLLKVSGLMALEGRDFNFFPTIVHIFCMHCCLLIASTMYLYGTISKIARSKGNIDVQAVAETIGLCGVHVRYLLTFASRVRIANIIAESRYLWQQLTTEEEKIIKIFVAKSIKFAKFYVIMNVVMCVFYVTASQLPLFSINDAKNFNRTLPYMFYTDVEASSPYFTACLLIQTLSIITVCISSFGVDSTALFFIMLACGHFRTLCTRLNLLQQSATKHTEADIVNCIIYHQKIIVFCKQIENLLSSVFLVQLFSTNYNIALIGLKLAGDDPDKFKYATLMVVMLFQLFIIQWAPDLLVTESSALFKSAYFIPKSDNDDILKASKLIHIIIMSAQHSIQLRAGGYVNMSMEMFGSMIKGILSFFMVLRSFN